METIITTLVNAGYDKYSIGMHDAEEVLKVAIENMITKALEIRKAENIKTHVNPDLRITSSLEEHKDQHCSFCGKHPSDVRKVIVGPMVYICDECVQFCNEILAEESTQS